jgi:type IV secretory pathway VirD2 relaxase
LAKYFYHTSVNFPPHDNLKDEQMVAIAKDYLEAMGFDQHQYAIFRHFDADHPHIHILVNRIGYDGAVLSDSKDYPLHPDSDHSFNRSRFFLI